MVKTHGIPIDLNWSEFQTGASFFVPGVDLLMLTKEIKAEMRRLNIHVRTKQTTENGLLGVRVWRIP